MSRSVILQEKRNTMKKKILIICGVVVLLAAIAVFANVLVTKLIPDWKYDEALEAKESGDYEKAITLLTELGDYRGASEHLPSVYYGQGKALYAQNKFDEAILAFQNAGDHEDAAEQIISSYYGKGKWLREQKALDEAIAAFTAAGDYLDSAEQIKGIHYDAGMELLAEKNYNDAIAKLLLVGDYQDAQEQVAKAQTILMRDVSVGDLITFGAYEQDKLEKNGKESIQWLVLEKKEDRLLVISKDCLDCRPYFGYYTNINWSNSSARAWLNGLFKADAFTDAQQERILLTTNSTLIKGNGSKGYEETEDKLFLLSTEEAAKFLPTEADRKAKNTPYAELWGAYTAKNGCAMWWLRDPGSSNNMAASFVNYEGQISKNGSDVNRTNFAMRPAMWIDISE